MNKKSSVLNILCVVIAILLCFTGCGNNGDSGVTDNERILSNTENVEMEQADSHATETATPIQEDNSISEPTIPNNHVVATDLKPSEGLEFESNGDGTCTIIGIGVCADKDIVIPEKSPDGDMVTLIGEYAFYSREDLADVSICENSKSDNEIKIDDRTFQYCKRLEAVAIGNGNIEIGEYVFSGCSDSLVITIAGKNYTADAIKEGLK